MQVKYLKPEIDIVRAYSDVVMRNYSESEVTYNIGAKENQFFFDDEYEDEELFETTKSNAIWEEDEDNDENW